MTTLKDTRKSQLTVAPLRDEMVIGSLSTWLTEAELHLAQQQSNLGIANKFFNYNVKT